MAKQVYCLATGYKVIMLIFLLNTRSRRGID